MCWYFTILSICDIYLIRNWLSSSGLVCGQDCFPCVHWYGGSGQGKWNSEPYFNRGWEKMTLPPYLESRKWFRVEIQKKLSLFDVTSSDLPWCGVLRCNSNQELWHLKVVGEFEERDQSKHVTWNFSLWGHHSQDEGLASRCLCLSCLETMELCAVHVLLEVAVSGLFLSWEVSLLSLSLKIYFFFLWIHCSCLRGHQIP